MLRNLKQLLAKQVYFGSLAQCWQKPIELYSMLTLTALC